jgi:hypothetical protein
MEKEPTKGPLNDMNNPLGMLKKNSRIASNLASPGTFRLAKKAKSSQDTVLKR